MITKRKRTTMAPAYTMTCRNPTTCASRPRNMTAMSANVPTRPIAL